jgi:hypothetical protein
MAAKGRRTISVTSNGRAHRFQPQHFLPTDVLLAAVILSEAKDPCISAGCPVVVFAFFAYTGQEFPGISINQ